MQKNKLDLQKLKDNKTTVWRQVDVEPTIIDKDERLVEGRINTKTIDAYNTIIEPLGAEVEGFRKYASVLFNHAADKLIGNAEEIKQTSEYIDATWRFLPEGISELVDRVWKLYTGNWLNGYSIGFVPIEWEREDIDGLEVARCTDWSLKEFSLTSVPANPDALARNSEALQDWREVEKRAGGVKPTPLVTTKDLTTRNQNTNEEESMKSNLAVREVVEFQDLPIAEVDEWDAEDAVAQLRSYAGGPGKEDIDWDKYFKGFFYRNGDEAELFGSYKLPYAYVVDGELRAADQGIYAVAQVLEGARGGADIPDDQLNAIETQVEKYYQKMDETAPWNRTVEETRDNNKEKELLVEALKVLNNNNNNDNNHNNLKEKFNELKKAQEDLEEKVATIADNLTKVVEYIST